MVKKARKVKQKSKEIQYWQLSELIAAKVMLESRMKQGEIEGDDLQVAEKRLLDLKDELRRR
jgi:hypothetical protein